MWYRFSWKHKTSPCVCSSRQMELTSQHSLSLGKKNNDDNTVIFYICLYLSYVFLQMLACQKHCSDQSILQISSFQSLFFLVTLEGSCEGRVFDKRELKFEVGDGENLGFPIGVEKAILAMEQGEEATFTMKPKYDHLYQDTCLYFFVK